MARDLLKCTKSLARVRDRSLFNGGGGGGGRATKLKTILA